MKNPKNTLERQKKLERRAKKVYALAVALTLSMAVTIAPAFAADDPLQIVSNLSDFIFSLIRAVGLILLGFGILQVGLSLQSHDKHLYKGNPHPHHWRVRISTGGGRGCALPIRFPKGGDLIGKRKLDH